MAGGKGNALAEAFLGYILGGGSAPSQPATVYCALFTAAPSDAGGGTEVSGGSYARVAITNNATNFPAPSLVGGVPTVANGTLINFGTASAGWGAVGWAALFDASSGGNLLYWGPLPSAVTVNSGDSFDVPIGGAVFTEK